MQLGIHPRSRSGNTAWQRRKVSMRIKGRRSPFKRATIKQSIKQPQRKSTPIVPIIKPIPVLVSTKAAPIDPVIIRPAIKPIPALVRTKTPDLVVPDISRQDYRGKVKTPIEAEKPAIVARKKKTNYIPIIAVLIAAAVVFKS